MVNQITATGLEIDSLQTIITTLEDGLKGIYGNDINVDSNSPDGQLINIEAVTVRDILVLLQNINASFDPDQAQGIVLDQRVAINNIQRLGATYTFQDVTITVDRAVSLQGLDADANDPDGVGFTVADSEGNQFILLDTQTPVSAGSYTYSFRAKDLGAIETTINTITIAQTVVAGVTGVNNSTVQSSLGQNEESDFQLRERRKQSTANRSKASIEGVLSNILQIDGVVNAVVYENDTDSVDANGLLPHSLYAVVLGGANTDIADIISKYKSVGCNMNGDVEVDVEIANSTYIMKFDRPEDIPLYIRFSIKPLFTGLTFDQDEIKDYIVANKVFDIGEIALADDLSEIAKDAIIATSGDVGAIVNLEISDDDATWTYFVEVGALKEKWNLATANIDITIL
jgi:uncharacterized phage protein gp47/JayE